MTHTENDSDISDGSRPNGILVAVGGNEDKEQDLSVLRTIKNLVKKEIVNIEIITTASEIPVEIGEAYVRAFEKIGGNNLGLLHIKTREQAMDDEIIQRIKKTDIVFFCGGDQLKITSVLGGSPLLHEIKRRFQEEYLVVAGTSAGATALPDIMIYDGESHEALLKGTVSITGGIGLIKGIVIDSHFIVRGRFSRLMQVISMNPGCIGLGLGEDTGVIIENGCTLKAIGFGLVVIFDGSEILYTNVAHINDKEAIAVENMRIHTIVKDHGYDLNRRTYLKPAEVEVLPLISNQ